MPKPQNTKKRKASNKKSKQISLSSRIRLKLGKFFYPAIAVAIAVVVGASGYYTYYNSDAGAGKRKGNRTVKVVVKVTGSKNRKMTCENQFNVYIIPMNSDPSDATTRGYGKTNPYPKRCNYNKKSKTYSAEYAVKISIPRKFIINHKSIYFPDILLS